MNGAIILIFMAQSFMNSYKSHKYTLLRAVKIKKNCHGHTLFCKYAMIVFENDVFSKT